MRQQNALLFTTSFQVSNQNSKMPHILDLARKEVEKAAMTVKAAIMKICEDHNTIQDSKIVLDAPRYFFVSNNLSQYFPNLLESVIIQSYHTCYLPEYTTPWMRSTYTSSTLWKSSKSRAIKSIFTSMMQQFGSTSPTIQRFMIHLIQPLLVSSLIFLWAFFFNNPIWFILPTTLIGLAMIFYWFRSQRKQDTVPLIHPALQDDQDVEKILITPTSVAAPVSTSLDVEEKEEMKEESMFHIPLNDEEIERERRRFDSADDSLMDSIDGEGISLDFSSTDQNAYSTLSYHFQHDSSSSRCDSSSQSEGDSSSGSL